MNNLFLCLVKGSILPVSTSLVQVEETVVQPQIEWVFFSFEVEFLK